MKPILDKAEVSIDLAEKYYRSSFERDASFEVRTDEDQLVLKLVYKGDGGRIAGLHLHYFLLADILEETANSIAEHTPIDDVHREPLIRATKDLLKALEKGPRLMLVQHPGPPLRRPVAHAPKTQPGDPHPRPPKSRRLHPLLPNPIAQRAPPTLARTKRRQRLASTSRRHETQKRAGGAGGRDRSCEDLRPARQTRHHALTRADRRARIAPVRPARLARPPSAPA